MRILAFARTTPALLAGVKSVTRRDWSKVHHYAMVKALERDPFLQAQAWSNGPHRNGKKVAIVGIEAIYREMSCVIPYEDWEAEGFEYMTQHGLMLDAKSTPTECWRRWKDDPDRELSVVRFRLISIEPGMTPELFFKQ